jgi:hypothetical protein
VPSSFNAGRLRHQRLLGRLRHRGRSLPDGVGRAPLYHSAKPRHVRRDSRGQTGPFHVHSKFKSIDSRVGTQTPVNPRLPPPTSTVDAGDRQKINEGISGARGGALNGAFL